MYCLVTFNQLKIRKLLLLEHLNNNSIDIAVVTETWLNDDTDDAWVSTSELNRNGFNLDISNQNWKKRKEV